MKMFSISPAQRWRFNILEDPHNMHSKCSARKSESLRNDVFPLAVMTASYIRLSSFIIVEVTAIGSLGGARWSAPGLVRPL